MSVFCRFMLLLVMVVSCGVHVWGQTSSASLRGTVVDSKGAVLPDAELLLRNVVSP